MKRLYILKVGSTFPATAKQFGDFDTWTTAGLGTVGVENVVVDVENGEPLPAAEECAGVVITGSHDMVTDELAWSVALERWIRLLLEEGTPLLGICYGHQLLAKAAGGEVGFHPRGKEIGTVRVDLIDDLRDDGVFRSLPRSFVAHVTHSQTVLQLPTGAIRLAANDFEPNHAFRLGKSAWGVQFHPEYNAPIMRSYVEEQAKELRAAGRDVSQILDTVVETPAAAETLANFGGLVRE